MRHALQPDAQPTAASAASSIKDVLVLLQGGADDAATVEYAARLASEHAAHLTGAFAYPALAADGPAAFATGRALEHLLATFEAEASRTEAAARASFERRARAVGAALEWRTVRRPPLGNLVTHARYADVTILSRPVSGSEAAARTLLAQSIVFGAGRPVLVLPGAPPATIGRRILIGWNASREATRAVTDALPLLTRADAVELFVVDPERRVERHGPAPGADIGRHLARHGVRVDVRVVESGDHRTAELLLARADGFGADLLLIGAYGHARFTELVFGGVTRAALLHAERPLWLSR
jgi:nucleotide-binding universal stress UspA family protein